MSIYVVIHLHAFGSTAYLVSSETSPTAKQLVRELNLNFEPSKSESLEVCEISDEEYGSPAQLAWRDGDDEEFDEFAVDGAENTGKFSGEPNIS